ncbi:MAG TPA: kelch repeat-containing protein, partial [Actinomycetes bacterium]|nr:kelch repeat-containing protein [Actinomycetes bacterium]
PDGRVLVAGGEGEGAALASAELYDPASGSWIATGSLVGGDGHGFLEIGYQTATLLADGTVLATAGSYFGGPLSSAQLYDPSSGSWIATANLVESRSGHTATLLPDGRVLVAGGAIARCDSTTTGGCIETNAPVSGELASAEVYDPGNRSWTAAANMVETRGGHTATLLPDGRVLVAGGYSPIGEVLASAELYDPGSGS